jgi:uncharacterized phiE125 gp8 family phage protein
MTIDRLRAPLISDAALSDARAVLRLDLTAEDALLDLLLRAALDRAESFIGVPLLRTGYREDFAAARLLHPGRAPLRLVESVSLLDGEDAETLLAITSWERQDSRIEILAALDTEVRLRVHYDAGLKDDWADLPESLRAGVLLLTAHLFEHRDGAAVESLPAPVVSLWTPWRRRRLA